MGKLNAAMKKPTLPALLFAVSLLAASQPLLAAATKADARATELVAALQAVSPDPLGGRLGLAAATVRAAAMPSAKDSKNLVQSQIAERDQRAYAIWKGSRKS